MKLLIFDLDDTIFETKSIPIESVAPILKEFKQVLKSSYDDKTTDLIIADIWKSPFDFVAEKYGFTNEQKHNFTNSVDRIEYDLDIKPFEDFEIVRKINIEKVLVTTGFKKLQHAKIAALKIGDLFKEIAIDDITNPKREGKIGIFRRLLQKTKYSTSQIMVIGDNPQSELEAGKNLGMTTVQLIKLGQQASEIADFHIESYTELKDIL